jgi:hypothetical protein
MSKRLHNLSRRVLPGSGSRLPDWAAAGGLVLLGLGTLGLAGCGGASGSPATAGPISVVAANGGSGKVTSVALASTLQLSMAPAGDKLNAGVDWTVACGGNPVTGSVVNGACGTLAPLHTSDGGTTMYTAPSLVPIGSSVTITATVASNPSQSSSVSFTIVPTPITVSFLIAPPASLGVNAAASVEAQVANDPTGAGVIWTATCGAAACGSFYPAESLSTNYTSPSVVPAGGAVTITATSLTDTTKSASATVAIAAPIAVTLSPAPPASLTVGTTATLAATVASDPNNLGVNWTATCASVGACGSFNLSPAHTASGGQIAYTAPATVPAGGGAVTITAASPAATPSNPGVAITTIVASPPTIALTLAPPATLASTQQAPVSATVANDASPGGVAWSVQCGSTVAGGCGWVAPAQTADGATAIYTAPPVTATGTSVTVVATSVANSGLSATSNPIAIVPATTLSVAFIPSLPAQVQPNGTVNLTAAVANDATAGGVDWQVCGSGCGFFTVKPAIPAVAATSTTPYQPPVAAVTATSVSGWSNGLPIPYTAPSTPPASGAVAVAAAAHANPAIANSGTIAIGASASGPALNGAALAGTQPIVGATISLYAAGNSGYGSAASRLATATTAKDGSFAVPSGYSCPSAASQMYLVANGGAVGRNAANPNLALMTALGGCANLGSAAVVINEVTTVASAFATAPFAANDALTGNSSYLYLGASAGNVAGLANAFAAVNNLVDISTGRASYFTPAGNAATPYVAINTLAGALHACAATSGGAEGDGSPCGTLFTAADVLPQHAIYNSIAPVDTLQAAFNIAEHPVTNYGYQPDSGMLFGLAAPNSPFQPILAAQPNDWSLSLRYTGGGGLSSASAVGSFAVDASGNLWITDTANNAVVEMNPVGAAISPATGFSAGGGPIAIDASGNVWTSGNGALYELTGLGAAAPGSPFGGVAGGGSDIAIDAQGNLWIANGGGVGEFSNLGVAVSPAGGFSFDGLSAIGAVGVDSSSNVWIGNTSDAFGSFAELSNPGASLIANGQGAADGSPLPQMAADGAGNIWGIVGPSQNVCEVPPYGGKGSTLLPTCYGEFQNANTSGELNFFNAAGVAVDGAGTAWVASQGGGNPGSVILPSVLPIAPSLFNGGLPNYLASPSLAAGPLRVAVDGSGNLWVLLADNTVAEYIGVAAPAVAPIALALKNNKLGAKP